MMICFNVSSSLVFFVMAKKTTPSIFKIMAQLTTQLIIANSQLLPSFSVSLVLLCWSSS